MIESFTAKTVLLLLAGGVAVGAGTGFIVGRATSPADPMDRPGSGASVFSDRANPSAPGEFPASSRSEGMKSSSVRPDSGSSWHPFTGPYTAERWMEFRKMLLGISAGEIPDALEHLATLPASQERFELERELLSQWATLVPREALEFAGAIENSRHRVDATEVVLRAFAAREPQAAFQWLEAQRDQMPTDEYNRLFDDALRGYADQSLESAIDHFATWHSTLDRRQVAMAVDELMESLIQQGLVSEAAYYLDKFPEGSLRSQAAQEFISELARVDLDKAISMVEQLSGRDNADDLQRTLVREWSRSDPAAAADYLTEKGDQLNNFSSLASEVIRRWDDVTAASEWLSQYEPSPELDRATLMLVYRAGNEDPAGAFTWAQSVNDPGIRMRALQTVASNWKAQDEAAFNTFIGKTQGLTEEELKIMESAPARSSSGGWGRWGR